MAREIKTPEAFCAAFLKAFPPKPESSRLACDESTTWMRVIDGAPTTGECSVEGLPIVDYYEGREPLYHFSVLTKVAYWAKTVGWHAELQDPGTVKFYKD